MTPENRFYWSWNRSNTKCHLWRPSGDLPLCQKKVTYSLIGTQFDPALPLYKEYCTDCARIAESILSIPRDV